MFFISVSVSVRHCSSVAKAKVAPYEVSSALGFPAASGFARSVDDEAMKGGQKGKCEIITEIIIIFPHQQWPKLAKDVKHGCINTRTKVKQYVSCLQQ